MSPASTPLEDQIQELEELDKIRTQFALWRSQGRQALKQFVACRENPGDQHASKWNLELHQLGDGALVVKCLCRPGDDISAFESLLKELRAKTLNEILGPPEDTLFNSNSMSTVFFDAALALDALASAPSAVFNPATMLYYYITVRELYYPTPPTWVVGGARAGAGGRPSAFTTSQFVRGIFSFARMLERTGQYLGALAEMQQKETTGCVAWDEQDARRRALSLHTTLAQRAWNLAFELKTPVAVTFEGSEISKFQAAVRCDLIVALTHSVEFFKNAAKAARDYREEERLASKRGDEAQQRSRSRLIARSEGAHAIAIGALEDAIARAEKARRVFPEVHPDPAKPLTESERKKFAEDLIKLKNQFAETAAEVRKLTEPATDYLSSVLDTQLARASATTDTVGYEAVEMASAAATLGAAGKGWDDERLLRAATFLGAAMTPDGFAIAKPYHTGKGSYYQPTQPHVMGAYAQILEHVQAELSPTILKRISRYFEINTSLIDKDRSAWRWAHASPTWPYSPYHTAVATLALDRLARMLDARINQRVLVHFGRKEPTKLKLRLQDLFYPDYGLATVLGPQSPRIPIAVALERMRAHIAGVPLRPPYREPLYSVVFHGPPGTGKTTLLEALAASAEVPLVEVTPSDIVVRGAEAVEARARAVLSALSLLTRVVILFDEFDPVLKTRKKQGEATSIFTFLTPSMLPKLKTLYETAKTRHVAYALITNVVRELDPAATRGGRFDAQIGVYPPDALSRYGRLLTEVKMHLADHTPPQQLGSRFRTIVKESHCAAMQAVGQPGWFSRPRGEIASDTLFGYLFAPDADMPLPVIPQVDEAMKQDGTTAPKPEEDLWSPNEKKDWEKIRVLEESSTELGRKIWLAVDAAFPARPNVS